MSYSTPQIFPYGKAFPNDYVMLDVAAINQAVTGEYIKLSNLKGKMENHKRIYKGIYLLGYLIIAMYSRRTTLHFKISPPMGPICIQNR